VRTMTTAHANITSPSATKRTRRLRALNKQAQQHKLKSTRPKSHRRRHQHNATQMGGAVCGPGMNFTS